MTQLYVCKTCRPQNFKGRLDRCPGARFGRALKARVKARGLGSEIGVTAVQCLGVCDRPCTMAFAGEGKFSYTVGDLDRDRDLDAAIDFAQLYAASGDGIPPKSERPEAIQAGIVARLPSLGLEHPRITEISSDEEVA